MDYTWKGFVIDTVAFTLMLLIALIPWWLARKRGDPHRTSILIVGLFTSWTFFGWVLALAFAVRGKGENWKPKEKPVKSLFEKLRSNGKEAKEAVKNKFSNIK